LSLTYLLKNLSTYLQPWDPHEAMLKENINVKKLNSLKRLVRTTVAMSHN